MSTRKNTSLKILIGSSLLATSMSWAPMASASEPFIGQIQMHGFNFAPRGWAFCDGQLLPISSYTALYSLLGTTFGGDGRTTFGLPDLRGRSAKHVGTGPGLTPVTWGQRGGAETVTLTTSNMAAHSHALKGNNSAGNSATPGGNTLASKSRTNIYSSANAPDVNMHSGSIANSTGGGTPVQIRNPYLGIYHSIALVGIFPSRN